MLRRNCSGDSSMKVFLSILLAAVVCAEIAHTLQCYSCSEPVSAGECLDIVNCTTNDTMCKTTMFSREEVFPILGDATVTRACASRCTSSDADGIGLTRPMTCCNTDLCNLDGATSIRSSYLVVGFSAASFFVFLRTGL